MSFLKSLEVKILCIVSPLEYCFGRWAYGKDKGVILSLLRIMRTSSLDESATLGLHGTVSLYGTVRRVGMWSCLVTLRGSLYYTTLLQYVGDLTLHIVDRLTTWSHTYNVPLFNVATILRVIGRCSLNWK